MSARRLSMRKSVDLLRFQAEGLSVRPQSCVTSPDAAERRTVRRVLLVALPTRYHRERRVGSSCAARGLRRGMYRQVRTRRTRSVRATRWGEVSRDGDRSLEANARLARAGEPRCVRACLRTGLGMRASCRRRICDPRVSDRIDDLPALVEMEQTNRHWSARRWDA